MARMLLTTLLTDHHEVQMAGNKLGADGYVTGYKKAEIGQQETVANRLESRRQRSIWS